MRRKRKNKKVTKKLTNKTNENNNIITKGKENQTLSPNQGVVFDFSFDSVFCLVNINHFYNRCKNEKHFIECMMDVHNTVSKLTNKSLLELLQRYTHCHEIEEEKKKTVIQALEKMKKGSSDQLIGNEKLIQLGFEGSPRIIGFESSQNIFHVVLLDLHHKLYPDEKQNDLNKKQCKYTPIQ